ncbi:MAG: tripartite tricarboxylate transporter permease [Thermodesulfobacteriota bacterium]|nr:tripartite tricarboxylate transporter permease [Thermodesulfobacteriota bacterium]
MFESMLLGAKVAFSPLGIFYTCLGAAVGYLIGFLPGISASVGLSLLIPLTYGMDPALAMAMLCGLLGGCNFGGSVTAILFNAPGEGSNAATSLDGYPMARQGRGAEALGASASSGFLGHLMGLVALVAVIPIMVRVVLLFGPPEWFALGIGGLFLVASVSGGSMLSGLLGAAFGLLLSTHGVNPIVGEPRYTFGLMPLWDGIPLVVVIVGLMAIGEFIRLYSESEMISITGKLSPGGTWTGIKASFTHFPLVAISGIIGVVIGAVPGVGGNVSSWVALSQGRAMSKRPDLFGKGSVEGVIAPESANDSVQGGALMPTLALGIPGSPSTAVLLGAFIMHGLVPGQKLLTQNLPVVFSICWAHLLGAFVSSSLGLWLSIYLARMTVVPSKILAPFLTVVSLLGVYAMRQRILDVIIAIGFGLVGYLMGKCNFPRVPVILGFILGPLIERSLQVSLQLSDGSYTIFFTRPYSLIFMLFIPLSLVMSKLLARSVKAFQKSPE